jgi:hypothetical protein
MLSNILDHASTRSDNFGNIIRGNDHVEWIPGEFIALSFVVLVQSLTEFFDTFLNVFECSFHCTNRLIRTKDTVVIVLVTSHVDSKIVFKILCEVSMLSDNEATCISIHNEF